MVNMRRRGFVDPPSVRRSWRIAPPLLLQWLSPHLTTRTSQPDCITRCFQGEILEHSDWDQIIEVCLVCAPKSTCVDVRLRFTFLDLAGLLGKVDLFSLPLRPFVSLQHLRLLVARGVEPLFPTHLSQVFFSHWPDLRSHFNTHNPASLFHFSSLRLSHAPLPLPWNSLLGCSYL